ncbi:MAG: YeeE/YedE family protein [Bdellovibrionales bacterium]|nr:YeeE/YedE family protein [Bdellovibrionales bacterium]
MDIILAIVFGTGFGFVLTRVGAADPDKIVGMLSLRDLHLMKAILFAIGLSSSLLFIGLQIGLVDASHLSVKDAYLGVLVGGLMLGFGWAYSGYCPGTGIVAAGTGRKDGYFFILGGLLGAGVYALLFGSIAESSLFGAIAGGKVSLVATGVNESLLQASWSPVVAIAIGMGMMALAKALPANFRK